MAFRCKQGSKERTYSSLLSLALAFGDESHDNVTWQKMIHNTFTRSGSTVNFIQQEPIQVFKLWRK